MEDRGYVYALIVPYESRPQIKNRIFEIILESLEAIHKLTAAIGGEAVLGYLAY